MDIGLLEYIRISDLYEHPDNPRKDLGDLAELTASIRANGILQNLTVVQGHRQTLKEWEQICAAEGAEKDSAAGTYTPDWIDDGYTVIIGHRRLAAAREAGLQVLPCIVADLNEEQQFNTMMVENMQRSDLTPLEEADGFQLMIDSWGNTVQNIASQTGISETTVRRRLAMASMDRKLVQKGLERGATIDDYMKLTKIKDDTRREKCLKDIGTPNFKATLAYQAQAEKDEEYLDQVEAELEACGWCHKMEHKPPMKGWSYQFNYGKWSKRKFEKPADAAFEEYVYWRGVAQIDLYRKDHEVNDLEEERRKARHDKLKDTLGGILNELEWEYQSFRDMREDFIDQFDRYHRCREEILTMAAREMIREDWSHSWREEACNALGVKWHSGKHEPEQDELDMVTHTEPEKCLLWMTYLRMEVDCSKTWNRMWDGDIQATYPVFVRSFSLERLYSALTELGYEMSKEEEAFIQGSCLQFEEAKAEIAKYKEEMAAWKN